MEHKNCSDNLWKARKYEKAKIPEIAKEERAVFHLCSPIGWINDPNGFSAFKGVYHLFYQYHPYGTYWGPMHWGHSTTRDFIRWEQLPAALAPDTEYDGQGCFSGSAIEYEGKHILMYTGIEERMKEDGTQYVRQRQCIAVGDGVNYEKLKENPVISADLLPEGSSREDFRDPKIWRENGRFYAVIGSRASDGSGQIPLFESENLRDWNYVTMLERCENKYGRMWECPDFFRLQDKQILMVSPQDMCAKGLEFHSGNGTIYILGSFDDQKKFIREAVKPVDYGLDFYAPQTMETVDGRRIMIGWMQSWDNHICPEGRKWSGLMTIPRELFIKDGRMYQMPVRELEAYRRNETVCEWEFGSPQTKQAAFSGIKGRSVDLDLEVKGAGCHSFKLEIAKGEEVHTDITYDRGKGILSFDRTYCGLKKDDMNTRSMYAEFKNDRIKLRILIDRYSVEIFVNDGEKAMTSLIDSPAAAEGIVFTCDGECRVRMVKYDIVGFDE